MQNVAQQPSDVGKGRQRNLNGEVQDWYRIVLGYSDQLVGHVLSRFNVTTDDKVLDPFCGPGTTLVECMKRGIFSTGIDANPASCFAARVKTRWTIRPKRLLELLRTVDSRWRRYFGRDTDYRDDRTYQYLENSGMIQRGWISRKPLHKAIALKNCILDLPTTPAYKRILTLALVSEVVTGAANVKFGPELYCTKPKVDARVLAGFRERVKRMASDLRKVYPLRHNRAEVFHGDSRDCYGVLKPNSPSPYAVVICSPPYPAEHDYTRNARLELAFLEHVTDRESLRQIKRAMLRSHTKGIYKQDNDRATVQDHPEVQEIVRQIEPKARKKKHGFAALYTTVVQEYFGGMKRHLAAVRKLLEPRALCAYVVGDQSSYLRVPIPTASVLGSIAEEVGYGVEGIETWRTRWSTTTSKEIQENILILRNAT